MANPEQIETELRAYLEEESNLSKRDKFTHLKAIFDKHFAMDKADHLINYEDFHDILMDAKKHYANVSLPMYVNKKEIYSTQTNNISMIEATVNYLSRMKLLKRLVNIDYTK